jgi:hypothetical protein
MKRDKFSSEKVLSVRDARWDLDVLVSLICNLVWSAERPRTGAEKRTKSVTAQSCATSESVP